MGGWDEQGKLIPMDHFSVFDPRTATHERKEIRGDEIPPRLGFTIGLNGRRLYIFGGDPEGSGYLDDLFVIDLDSLVSKQLRPPAPSPSSRGSCLDWVWEKKLFVLGGEGSRR